MDITPQTNRQNIDSVRRLIAQKIGDNPYFATNESVLGVVTDRDHHPYTRYYRGVYNHDEAIIMEREAGYRQEINPCYKPVKQHVPDPSPDLCFEPPCSTTFPCYASDRARFKGLKEENEITNKMYMVQYY